MQPFDFQREDLDTLRRNGYVGLLNMQTGSGKTAVSCWAIQESGAKTVLILTPAQTIESAWKPTVRKILGVEAQEIGNSTKAKREALFNFELGIPGIYIATHQLFTRADVSSWSGDMVVVDEAHANGLATPKSKGQRKLSGYTPTEARKALSTRFPRRILLSGTALRNRFELAWSHSRFLWPELYMSGQVAHDNAVQWMIDRMHMREIYTNQRDQWGNAKKVKQFYGEKNPGQWVNEAPCVITHFKREPCCRFHQAKRLPDGRIHPGGYLPLDKPVERHETVPLLPAQKKAIRELEDHMMTYLEEQPMVVDIPLTQAIRIRQVALAVPTVTYNDEGIESVDFAPNAESPLADRILDYLAGDYDDEPVVVYTDSRKFAGLLVSKLAAAGISAFEYSGYTKKTRDEQFSRFGTDYRVMVAVLAATAEGVDGMQKVSKTEFWASTSLDETLNEQARGRLDRIHGVGQVERIYFHDDLGLSENRFSDQVMKRLELNRSLRKVS